MNRECRFATAFVTLLTFLTFSGCKPPSPPVYTDPVKVQQLTRVPIPPSATNVMCRTDRDDAGLLSVAAPDSASWGRFDIPAADLPLVLGTMPKDCKPEPASGHSSVTTYQIADGWWHPEQLQNPQQASWSEPGFSFNLMFGSIGQEGMLTVYFFNFSM